MKVLITGITGFIGDNLSRFLYHKGFEVYCLTRQEYNNEINNIVYKLKEVKPDVVVHLATYYVKNHSIDDIDKLVESNLLFGIKLLEAMDIANCRRIVNVTSAWQETHENLYASTKAAFYEILQYYILKKSFIATTLVLSDTYGANDSRTKVVNIINNAFKDNKGIELLSSAKQRINLTYIDDITNAFYTAISNDIIGKYDVMNEKEVTLQEIVNTFEIIYNKKADIVFGSLYNDIYIPQNMLPMWKANISLLEGLKNIV